MTGRNTIKLNAAVLSLLFASSAWAGLGSISVRSNLGEPLRAQIPLTGNEAGVADNLRVSLASPDAFRQLNVDYAPTLSSLRFAVVRQGGKAYVRVSSTQPINEPYLRFVVDARSPSGRSVREYTLLLDPADYPLRQPVLEQSLPGDAAAPLARASKPPVARIVRGEDVYVQPGQTLMSIARAVRPRGATLGQTMDALVAANPRAFIGGAPDSLRAGAKLTIPSAARIRAAGNTPARPVPVPAPATPTPTPVPTPTVAPAPAPMAPPAAASGGEVVKLTAPEAGNDTAARMLALEADIAQRDQALKETQAQIARLEQQLKALQQAPRPAAPLPVAAPEQESSWLDGVFGQLPLIGGGLAALLLAVLGVRVVQRRRRDAAKVGAALGARPLGGSASMLARGALSADGPATQGAHTFLTDFTRSSMGSLDASEVDPIAEAEVYLAYGRDQQAEDILKDALAKDPTRHEVRVKLLEIYAQRQDKAAFSQQAAELKAATDARGALWERAVAMGVLLDPSNPLYSEADDALLMQAPPSTSAAPVASEIDLDAELLATPAASQAAEPVLDFAAPPAPAVSASAPASAPADDGLDFDLDALLNGSEAPSAAPAPAPTAHENLLDFDFANTQAEPVTVNAAPAPQAADDFDSLFELDTPSVGASTTAAKAPAGDFDALFAETPPLATPAPVAPAPAFEMPTFEMPTDSFEAAPAPTPAAAGDGFESLFASDTAIPSPTAEPASRPATPAPGNDFDALFDLDAEFAQAPGAPAAGADAPDSLNEPLATKLDLARVYLDMGDKEGAREVLSELLSEANGPLHAQAQALMDQL